MADSRSRRGGIVGLAAKAGTLFSYLLEGLAAATLLAMMTMTAIDVAGRYLFSAPLGFAFEMTELAMAALVFCGLPGATARSSHVTVGLFENAFRGRAAIMRDVAIAVVSAAGCGFLSWQTLILAERFGAYGDRTSMLRVPIAPFAYGGALAWGLAAAVAIGLAVSIAMQAGRRD